MLLPRARYSPAPSPQAAPRIPNRNHPIYNLRHRNEALLDIAPHAGPAGRPARVPAVAYKRMGGPAGLQQLLDPTPLWQRGIDG